MPMNRSVVAGLVISTIVAAPVPALSARAADTGLALSDAYIQVIIPSRPAAGYFTLKNDGDTDRVLVGASSPGCGSTMLHKSESVGGVETMREVENVTVPAHGSVAFAPGGYHLMCMAPSATLKPGTTVQLNLSFKNGDTVTAEVPVRSVAGD